MAAKIGLAEMAPLALALLRLAAAGLFFAPVVIVYAIRGRRPGLRDMILLAGLGFIAISAYFWIQFNALQLTSAVNVSLLVATAPVWTALLGHWKLGERLNGPRWAGIAVGLVGAALVITKGHFSLALNRGDLVGGLLTLLNALLWATYTVAGRPLVVRYPPLLVTAYVGLFGLLFLVPLTGVAGTWPHLLTLSGRAWFSVFFLGLFCSGLGYFLWYWVLRRVQAAQAAAFLYLNPVVTTVLARVLLNEKVGAATVAGGLVTIAGVYLAGLQNGHPLSAAGQARRNFPVPH